MHLLKILHRSDSINKSQQLLVGMMTKSALQLHPMEVAVVHLSEKSGFALIFFTWIHFKSRKEPSGLFKAILIVVFDRNIRDCNLKKFSKEPKVVLK